MNHHLFIISCKTRIELYNFGMRNLISIFMVMALVITTGFAPSVLHANSHSSAKSGQTQISKGEDCHNQGEAKSVLDKMAPNDKDSSGKCCDKGICKCI